jgi:hypothetical protein
MNQLAERINSNQEDIAAVLKAFFLPKEFGHGFRLASEGAGMKSACANMSLSYDSGSWETTTVDDLLPADELIMCLFGNPLRSYIQFEHNPAGTLFAYQVQNLDGTLDWVVPQAAAVGGLPISIELKPRWATGFSSYLPHGPILFPGVDQTGHYYLWVDQGVASTNPATVRGLVVHLSQPPVVAAAGFIDWWYWNGKNPVHWAQSVITTGAQDYSQTVPAGGAYMYVTITSAEDLGVPQIATLTLQQDSATWGHHCVSDINSLLSSAYGIRVNSATVRVQNDSSPLYRNGKLVSVTVPACTAWNSIAPQGVDYIADLQQYRERVAENGYYGVLLPDSDADVSEFYDDISASSYAAASTLTQAAFPLVERRPFKIVGLRVPIAGGRAITCDVTHTIEYLTNNKLVGQNVSSFSEKTLIAAIVIASTMETDYDNPVHWRQILSTIATYLPLGAKALMTALQLFGYNTVAQQLEQRQPLVDKFAGSLQEISMAAAKNKRGSER